MNISEEKKEEEFRNCFDAVFTGEVDDITKIFLKEFWDLAYRQGFISGKEEQAEKMLKVLEQEMN